MPIPMEQRITAIILSLTLITVIIQLIRKNKLREEYALAWLATGFTILALIMFHKLVSFLAVLFGVTYAPTLIFAFGLLFVLIVLLTQSVTISSQADCIRDLAQSISLLEWRVQELENQKQTYANDNHSHTNGVGYSNGAEQHTNGIEQINGAQKHGISQNGVNQNGSGTLVTHTSSEVKEIA